MNKFVKKLLKNLWESLCESCEKQCTFLQCSKCSILMLWESFSFKQYVSSFTQCFTQKNSRYEWLNLHSFHIANNYNNK